MQYPCTSCGACCRASPPPAFKRADGVCRHYDDATRLCGIYDTRPLVCRVREGYEQVYQPHFGLRAYWMAVADVCEALEPQTNANFRDRVEKELQASGHEHGPADIDMDLLVQLTMETFSHEENVACMPPAGNGKTAPAGPVNGH
jgi:Fe-S-cluster containining protein